MSADFADLDLSSDNAWHGLRPGMTRGEVMTLLAAAGLGHYGSSSDPAWLLVVAERPMELRFEKDGAQRLRQISHEERDLTWRGEPILGVPLHEAWAVMRSEGDGAAWWPLDAVNVPLDTVWSPSDETVSDETLLHGGTLWLPQRGLGLVMCEGLVSEVVWRRGEDIPKQLAGPVTPAQLALSQKPDLTAFLRERMQPKSEKPATTATWTPLQWVLALAFIVSMGAVIKLGFEEMQRWQAALILDGRLTALEMQNGETKGYHIEYTDPGGKQRRTVLEGADFYVAPQSIGDAVQICYVPEEPPRVKGQARAQDAAFLRYLPWGAGVLLTYGIANMIAGLLAQRSRAAATAGTQHPAGRHPLSTNQPDGRPGRLPPGVPGVEKF